MRRKFRSCQRKSPKRFSGAFRGISKLNLTVPVNTSEDGNVLSAGRLSTRPLGKTEAIAEESRWLKVREPRQRGGEDD